MVKSGRVEPGRTPSVVSGRPSDEVREGEPLTWGEQPSDPGLRKLTSRLAQPSEPAATEAIPSLKQDHT